MIFLVVAVAYVFNSLVAYLLHRMLHCTWSGPFYRAHRRHHEELYPPDDLFSFEYRSAGTSNTVWLFMPFFGLELALLGALVWGHVLSLVAAAAVVTVTVADGWFTNHLHDVMHLWKTQSPLVRLHVIHHLNTSKNYGIYSFFWDRVFRTWLR